MSETIHLFTVVLIASCIAMEAVSQLCFKHAANDATLSQSLVKPLVWLGVLVWGIEVVVWLNVLEHVPLSIAYPMMSLTYVATLVAGSMVFKETITLRHAVGAALITTGVACVGVSSL